MDRYLVTSALPYANGPIHFGHIAGAYLPADIYVRFRKLMKDDVVFICGTDEHGVAITISAELNGLTPEEHVGKNRKLIKEIFDKMNIEFDNFSRTTLPKHYDLSKKFFTELNDNGFIEAKTTKQLFCESCNRFLADRYVMGTCPKCKHDGARGDECTSCGEWLEPTDLINPKCKVCSDTPKIRDTKHWYLKLGDLAPSLKEWLNGKTEWKENVRSFVLRSLEDLQSRPITRDMNWGVPVPLPEAAGKVLYVWFDAPIGYISSTVEWAEKIGEPEKWKEYWMDEKTKLIHFIGKDNIPFHCIVWPAMLMGQTTKYILPENVPANEFYNLEGRQFSKSDGWYIDIDRFFQRYKTDSIRYAIAANAPENSDSEFQWKDFMLKNNSELANILGNLVHRTLKFLERYFDSKIPEAKDLRAIDNLALQETFKIKDKIKNHFEKFEVRKVCFELMEIGRLGNKYFDEKAPWASVKNDMADCNNAMSTLCRILQVISVCAYPVIPESASKLWKMLGFAEEIKNVEWTGFINLFNPENNRLGIIETLFNKIDEKEIEEEIEILKKALEKKKEIKKMEYPPLKTAMEYEDFEKCDFRIGKILEAEEVPKSKKLLKLKVDIGIEQRVILSGIKEYYTPEALIGKQVAVLVNLKPRMIMGIESNGMILAASLEDKLSVLLPEGEVYTGSEIS